MKTIISIQEMKDSNNKQMYSSPESSVIELTMEATIALSDMDVVVLATDGEDF